MPARTTATSARRTASRPRLSRGVGLPKGRRTRTMCARSLRGLGPRRWKGRSGPEGALRDATDQGEEEGDGDPVHLLRHPHRQRGTPGGAALGTTGSGSGLAGPPKRFRNGVLPQEFPDARAKKDGYQQNPAVLNSFGSKKRSKPSQLWRHHKNIRPFRSTKIELNDNPYSICITKFLKRFPHRQI